MADYYRERLNAAQLYQVYQTKYPRVQRYLAAEIAFVRKGLRPDLSVLEIGAGYGRIMKELAPHAGRIVGIDIAEASVTIGRDYLSDSPNCSLRVMDAHDLTFDGEFDVVLCLQNGLSAIKGQPEHLVEQCLKALVPGGRAYFSTYSERFWPERLAWFHEQADKGLIGAIDSEKTHDGVVVCRDGFVAVTFSRDRLERLGAASGCLYSIEEVDGSSLFLILDKLEQPKRLADSRPTA